MCIRDRALLDQAHPATTYLKRLAVKTGGQVFFLNVEEIDWIEAAGNYAGLHIKQKMHLIRETMGDLEARLDPALFLRIHRSTIVNRDPSRRSNRCPTATTS